MGEEFERPFKEFEYLMKEIDRLAAEFDELMKIPEIEEFNKMMKAYDRFLNDPERMEERIERLKQTSGRSPSEFNKKYAKQDGAKEASGNTNSDSRPNALIRLKSSNRNS